jgi:integrase
MTPTVYIRIRGGKPVSPFWWFRYWHKGVRRAVKLDVRWEGTPPTDTKTPGDARFEASRSRAELRAEQAIKEIGSRRSEEDLLKRIHEVRTGATIKGVALDKMWAKWRAKPGRTMVPRYEANTKTVCSRFVTFVRSIRPGAREMADVTEAIAEEYANHEIANFAPKTAKDHVSWVRGVFKELRKAAALPANPFEDIEVPSTESFHRRPFTDAQLQAIIKAGKDAKHALAMRALVTSLTTCMRLGDCCRLDWADVKLSEGALWVVPNKTSGSSGSKVLIPIFPILQPILTEAAKASTSGPVFPDLALMYLGKPDPDPKLAIKPNPEGVTWRVDMLFKAAGIEEVVLKHKTGKRRVDQLSFAALRTTFITLALSQGVSEELLRKVTGHSAMEIVRKHYFMPSAETVKAEMKKLGGVFS